VAIFWLVFLAGLAIAVWRFWQVFKPLTKAPGDARFDRIGERLAGVFVAVGLHRRLLQQPFAGTLHLMILSSFIVLFTAIVQAFGSGLFPGFSLAPIGGDSWIALLQDVFASIILVALGMAVWQRYIRRPKRFQGSNSRDAGRIYLLIAAVVLTMLLEFSFRIAAGGDPSAPWRPVSSAIAGLLTAAGLGGAAAEPLTDVFYWLHVLAILGFLIYLPGSKHRHMMTAAPNIFFRSLEPKGRLPDPQPQSDGSAGVRTAAELSWKQQLDLLSCTECGRCQAACPAYAAGQPLSPKRLIMDIRDDLLSGGAGPLAGDALAEETLWSCTTCRACMEVCPLHIEHVPKIVEQRRQLVETASLEPRLQTALAGLQEQGNAFAKAPRQRARWTRSVAPKLKDARKEPVEWLWFVGDTAAFDPRVQPVTMRLAGLFQQAGLDIGILYEEEKNSGNDVRRVGEEGLYEILAQANIEALEACDYKRIVTSDPHSFNALKNEYPTFGFTAEILHHSQLLLSLLEEGRLPHPGHRSRRVTYHDPCYLGRYNGIFEPPRQLIRHLGHSLIEMPRNRANSFCCGAGGGRIWMDDAKMSERPSENRIKEALTLDVELFVVACPKDKVMYSAAVETLGVEDKLEVRDLSELAAPPETASETR